MAVAFACRLEMNPLLNILPLFAVFVAVSNNGYQLRTHKDKTRKVIAESSSMQLSFLTLANFCRSSEILSSLSLVTLSSFPCHSTMLLFASSFIFNSDKDNIVTILKATQVFKPDSSLFLILLTLRTESPSIFPTYLGKIEATLLAGYMLLYLSTGFLFFCCQAYLACPR